MAYRKGRSYGVRRYSNRDKYSVEQTGFTLRLPTTMTNGLYLTNLLIVSGTTLEGMRKVKHLTVTFSSASADNELHEYYWALVYVPAGYTVNPLFSAQGSPTGLLYEPNQFVMNCGYFDPSGGPLRVTSPVSRNLNSGDEVYLVIGTNQGYGGTGDIPTVRGIVRYAITLQ